MRLTVSHRTRYMFGTPVRGVVQSLRLTPPDCGSQQVVDWSVSVAGGQLGAAFRDGAGDHVQTLTLRSEVDELSVEVAGVVETSDCGGVLTGHRETVPPPVYLRRTPTTRASQGIRDLADAAADAAAPVLERAHALARAVTGAVAYAPGETGAGTTAAEALDLGRGVCQDQAHVLIAAATCAGIPARYVAGYLFSASGETMAEASHAWAELHVPGLGWVGFDPANACCPDDRYIRLGSGYDALDAAPIRGLALGHAAERMEVEVNVAQAQQQSQA